VDHREDRRVEFLAVLNSEHSSTGCGCDMVIRPAVTADLEAINDIYNHYVFNSTCTYQTEAEPMELRGKWFENHGAAHPVIVAEEAGVVVGWGSLSKFHQRAAYSRTVENSVYVHHAQQRRGIGWLLLTQLIELAGELGHHTIIALIDAEQTPSVAVHAKAGFEKVALLKEVGFKFGRWLDVVYMQRMVGTER